jgi:predicted DNA-binding transcriptional regulator AlpA
MITELKARQSAKIGELRDALMAAGLLTLDQQAKALGLSRSTTWTILRANHKASGLSASIINRMLASSQLPPLVRAKVLEYIAERAAGLHGHNKLQLRRFTARLSGERISEGQAAQT